MFNLIPWKKSKGREVVRRQDHPLAELREELDALFDRFLSRWMKPFGAELGLDRLWALDVEDNGAEVVVRAEVPGFEVSELDVQVCGNLLTIKAEKKEATKDKEGNGSARERRYRTFHRTVTLPPGADAGKIEARYKNGLLEVHVPRSEEARGKRIQIKD